MQRQMRTQKNAKELNVTPLLNLPFCHWPSLRKEPTFRDATTSFPVKWRLRNQRRNSTLMTRQNPDLDSASD